MLHLSLFLAFSDALFFCHSFAVAQDKSEPVALRHSDPESSGEESNVAQDRLCEESALGGPFMEFTLRNEGFRVTSNYSLANSVLPAMECGTLLILNLNSLLVGAEASCLGALELEIVFKSI